VRRSSTQKDQAKEGEGVPSRKRKENGRIRHATKGMEDFGKNHIPQSVRSTNRRKGTRSPKSQNVQEKSPNSTTFRKGKSKARGDKLSLTKKVEGRLEVKRKTLGKRRVAVPTS